MIDVSALIEVGVKAIAPKLVEKVISAINVPKMTTATKVYFNAHFEHSYQRCTQIKTIISGDKPISLFDCYVSPDVSIGGRSLDEYQLIEDINTRKHTVILGTVGTGKSMLMRYLWVCYLTNPESKIPIFLELRKFDTVNANTFLNFLLYSVVDDPSVEKELSIKRLIEAGAFTFILDGFDELTEKNKAEVERSILAYCKYENRIIVSSRNSELFRSWQYFSIYEIQPFSLEKSMSVIKKIEFDPLAKRKFIKELKGGLYTRHESFASRPLLLSMMLLTFKYYADVPDKMHLFYEQAFETLCTRHDISKEMYKRESKTTYSIDLFKRYLGLFCLITYNDGNFEFTTSDVFGVLSKVERISGEDIQKQSFLADLLDWVCVLQKDGLQLSFTHRSFQEYFASLCMLSLPDTQVGEFVRKFAIRSGDNVINMIYDMNPDLIKRSFLEPCLNEYSSLLGAGADFDVMTYLETTEIELSVDLGSRSFTFLVLRGTSNAHSLRQAAYALHLLDEAKTRTYESIGSGYYILKGQQTKEFYQLSKSKEVNKKNSEGFFTKGRAVYIREWDRSALGFSLRDISAELSERVRAWIESTDLATIIKAEHNRLLEHNERLLGARREKSKSIDEIFSLPSVQ